MTLKKALVNQRVKMMELVFKSNWYELGPLIRQTGKMKEFNPEIQSLRIELDQKESTIQALK